MRKIVLPWEDKANVLTPLALAFRAQLHKISISNSAKSELLLRPFVSVYKFFWSRFLDSLLSTTHPIGLKLSLHPSSDAGAKRVIQNQGPRYRGARGATAPQFSTQSQTEKASLENLWKGICKYKYFK